MNLPGHRELTPRPVGGSWFRAVRLRHSTDPLGYAHTRFYAGRFTFGTQDRPRYAALYLAETSVTTQYEVQAMLGSPLPGRVSLANSMTEAWAVFRFDVRLAAVADLTAADQLELLGTSVQELTGDWEGYSDRWSASPIRPADPPLAPTQELGRALHAARRFEGLLTYSARDPVRRNLVVFPDRLRKGSVIQYTDPTTGRVHQLP